jgi:dihydropteroate synthase
VTERPTRARTARDRHRARPSRRRYSDHVLSLENLADLAAKFRDDLDVAVGPLQVGDRTFRVDERAVLMGCVNLSRDSAYRESVALSADSAVRKARILVAQGADLIDLGAESSQGTALRVAPEDQAGALVPVVERLAEAGVLVSVETYHVPVARACLAAGATMLNLTGIHNDAQIFDLVAAADATVILCYSASAATVRDPIDVDLGADPVGGLVDYFGARMAHARSRGVERIVLDPGLGFQFRNLTDSDTRVRYQIGVMLNTFRLRRLGVPICHAMPTAFHLFEEQVGIAEPFFAVPADLGRTSVYRVHEVARTAAVLKALGAIDAAR